MTPNTRRFGFISWKVGYNSWQGGQCYQNCGHQVPGMLAPRASRGMWRDNKPVHGGGQNGNKFFKTNAFLFTTASTICPEKTPQIGTSPLILFFCELEPHAKFHDPRTTPSGRKVKTPEEERRRENNAINIGHYVCTAARLQHIRAAHAHCSDQTYPHWFNIYNKYLNTFWSFKTTPTIVSMAFLAFAHALVELY